MNRKLVFLASLFFLQVELQSSAFAFQYDCFSFDDNEPSRIEKFVLKIANKNLVKITMAGHKFEETYNVFSYANRAPADTRPEVEFFLKSAKNNYADGKPSPFIADKDLLTGGYTLRNGKKGGFMKIMGTGLRFAKYICYLQK
ncbi:MAG: hypothetical protein QE271_04305 [Bacteriovoracaceae bacterium]|nr:hypothetical protein [Bacteriovoracaceae bacterium]